MSTNGASPHRHATPHVLPLSVYGFVFAALLVLTGITVWVSSMDLGVMAIHIAMFVATVKAALVVGYFMHLKFEQRFLTLVASSSVVFLLFFFVLTFIDLETRADIIDAHSNTALARDRAQAARAQRGTASAGPAAAAPPPAQMRSVKGTAASVAVGAELFKGNCVACHGADGEGRVGIGPRLNSSSFLAAASDAMLIRTIADGRAGTTMVPWKASLTQDKISALVAYIRTWKDVAPAQLDQSKLEGDSEEGEVVFRNICSACHGRKGAGYQETSNGTGIGRSAFLTTVSDGFLRYMIKNGKAETGMRGFDQQSRTALVNLTDAEIENVIAYLRENAW